MGSDAEAIGEIVPELRSKFPNLGVPPTFDPGSARFRLFDSITTYLKNASNDRTIVLMLEDLHWADASSLALLEHIVGDMAESNLLIVGTYRDNEVSLDHPLYRTLRNVVRHDGFQRPVIFSGIFGFAQRAQVFTKCSETNIYDCPGF
jgi:predicted ATPase